MKTVNWKQGLFRLYCALWGAGAVLMLGGMVYELFRFGFDDLLEYAGMWLGFAVLAPAVTLGLIVWVVKGFTVSRRQDHA